MPFDFKCPTCEKELMGGSCALTLCAAKGWRNVPGCTFLCDCHYPVKAKDVRTQIFKKDFSFKDNNINATANAYIYCQRKNQGHVYYGTYDTCVTGNGTTAASMSIQALQNSTKDHENIFERYN